MNKPDGGIYYEQLFGTVGFDGMSTLMYHIHRPTIVKEVGQSIDVSPKIAVQKNMKALLVSNMVASAPEYGKYAEEVLAKQMDPKILAEIRAIEAKKDFANPRYMELLIPNFYHEHICRLTIWPDALNRSFKHGNTAIYTQMQGPSEFGISGLLANWDIKNRLKEIAIPTLMIGAKYDTMDPKAMEEQSKMVQHGEYLYCPNGSHLAMWDDQKTYMNGVISFIKKVDQGK
jgi:proline iminopeptidase